MVLTTLILFILILLVLVTACDANQWTLIPLDRINLLNVDPHPPVTPSDVPTDSEYIPADHFGGCRVGYVFTTRNGKLGYHKDHPAYVKDVNLCETNDTDASA